MTSIMDSRWRVRPEAPRSSAPKEGARKDLLATFRGKPIGEVGLGVVREVRNEVRRAFVRILTGTSSRIEANVKRYLIKLPKKLIELTGNCLDVVPRSAKISFLESIQEITCETKTPETDISSSCWRNIFECCYFINSHSISLELYRAPPRFLHA